MRIHKSCPSVMLFSEVYWLWNFQVLYIKTTVCYNQIGFLTCLDCVGGWNSPSLCTSQSVHWLYSVPVIASLCLCVSKTRCVWFGSMSADVWKDEWLAPQTINSSPSLFYSAFEYIRTTTTIGLIRTGRSVPRQPPSSTHFRIMLELLLLPLSWWWSASVTDERAIYMHQNNLHSMAVFALIHGPSFEPKFALLI